MQSPSQDNFALSIQYQLRLMRWGLSLSVLAILAGFVLGGLFGAMEDNLKGYLKLQGEGALQSVYHNDEAAMQKVVSKSWSYFKRAHMHGGGIGAATLSLSLLLAGLTSASDRLRTALSTGMGLGALGYSVFWLLAGMRAPGLGSTDAAKESLNWLAIPSAGLLLLGVGVTLGLSFFQLWRPQRETQES